LIYDALNIDSILVIEKHLEIMLKLGIFERKKIFLASNLKFLNQNLSDEEFRLAQKTFSVSLKHLIFRFATAMSEN